MGTSQRGWSPACALLLALCCGGCSSRHIVVGTQCPSPYGKHASYAPGASAGAEFYGTSCAPCSATSISQVKLDKHGCPIYVTFESCGGDICLGNQQLTPPSVEAGAGEEDGGREPDAAATGQEDGGAL